ncbi:mRNA-capping enzyme [Orpheovirus IHUMI-LCC2]|uniref:mRNA 5'-phosphatase n=1 Tax=Orpheovirus IHUMI-LCC2 TaxID=2023057 RepID=A0A2I2L5W5_9VIRU|nr:mRNA-capping enzyme [Orpheovirus IHUMI-LCC2]SNW62945.1 mRNA-capping enzyme [Orpheovirus IHUMI-LCC2]
MLASNRPNIYNYIVSSNDLSTLEIEVRYGYYTNDGIFHPGVSRSTFHRLSKHFESSDIKKEITISTDYIGFNDKSQKVRQTENSSIQKVNLNTFNFPDFNYTVNISQESPSLSSSLDLIIIRNKTRHSYYLHNNSIRLDLTEALSSFTQDGKLLESNHGLSDGITYEVEIELLDKSNTGLDALEQSLVDITKLIQDSPLLYSNSQKIKLLRDLNMIFLKSTSTSLEDSIPSLFKTLRLDHMTWGDLLGNPNTAYNVCNKPDGIRKFLVIDYSGVWLIWKSEVSKILDLSDVDRSLQNVVPLVLDGELIPNSSRHEGSPISKYWYLAYDCLLFENNKSVMDRPHNKRMLQAQYVADRVKSNILRVDTMKCYDFRTGQIGFLPDRGVVPKPTGPYSTVNPITNMDSVPFFYKVMMDMLSMRTKLSYKTKGLIFRSNNTPYNPILSGLHETITPPNYIWRPTDSLFFDLQYFSRINPDMTPSADLLDANGSKFPYSLSTSSLDYLKSNNIPSGSILEVSLDQSSTLNINRIRDDKLRPNSSQTIEDILISSSNPISEDTLLGTSLQLMDNYHNSRLHDLFSRLFSSLISKFGNNLNVVYYGADPSDISILTSYFINAVPLTSTNITSVHLLYLGRNSTSLWESEDTLSKLISFIRSSLLPQSIVAFNMIDGDAVKQLFTPMFAGAIYEQINLDNDVLFLSTPKTLNYNGTIITLPFIMDIPFKVTEMKLMERRRLSGERFLSSRERILSDIISIGYLQFSSPVDNSKSIGGGPALYTIPVSSTGNLNDKATGDDRLEKLPQLLRNGQKYSKDLYRLGTIGDGSCFIHAVLKAFYAPYINNKSYGMRTGIVRTIRNELADNLVKPSVVDPSKSNYEMANGGQWTLLANEQKSSNLNLEVNFSLEGIDKLLRSSMNIGNEMYQYIADMIGINITILHGLQNMVYIHERTERRYDWNVFIVGNGGHFETVVLLNDDGTLQSAFPNDHSLTIFTA